MFEYEVSSMCFPGGAVLGWGDQQVCSCEPAKVRGQLSKSQRLQPDVLISPWPAVGWLFWCVCFM